MGRYLVSLVTLVVVLWFTLHFFTESQKSEFKELSSLAQSQAIVFNQANLYKMAIAEFYMVSDYFPNSLEELGGLPSTMPKVPGLQSIELQSGGVIYFDFSSGTDSESAGYYFVPEVNSGLINWGCKIQGFEKNDLHLASHLCDTVDQPLGAVALPPRDVATIESLEAAVISGNRTVLNRLISQGVDLNQTLPRGERALTIAVKRGDMHTLREEFD